MSISKGTGSLQAMKDELARAAHGMTRAEGLAAGICIRCRQPPPPFGSAAGAREYQISGLCEPCFDGLFAEDGE